MRLSYTFLRAAVVAALVVSTLGLNACKTESAEANGNAAAPGGNRPGGSQGGNQGGGRGGFGGGGNQISPVEITTVERVSIARTSLVAGQLAPLRVVGVTSIVAGPLLRVPVEEGSVVRQGQVLAELDARELEAQLTAAEKNLAFATSTAARSAELHKRGVVTVAEYERDQAALGAAEASVAQLRTRYGFTKIASPIDGVVMQRFVQAGDVVGGNSRMFTVADVSTLVVQLPVSELEVPYLREGSNVDVKVDALGQTVPGRIRRIFPAADSVSRLVPVEVAIGGATARQLRPGYTVRVTLNLNERPNALVVPTRAVVGAAGSQSVYVIRDGRAERRRVRVGPDTDGRTEVFEGLAAGDTVITTGNALLRDGAQVRIVEPLAPEGPGAAQPVSVPPAGARP
ncbi:MAG: efflux RND transporter periplasmic adaptor subunit [Gemmatimonadaceae bacterium]|nr:efflux RND transporter periplasmic adaptor subunit [Gemmatimonadaceae bacterium]